MFYKNCDECKCATCNNNVCAARNCNMCMKAAHDGLQADGCPTIVCARHNKQGGNNNE